MKAKFGAIVVAGSGKIGGHVASRNRAGAYFRTKVTPVNPQTTEQLAARSRLTTLSQAWRGLTQAQRDAWNSAVGDFSRTDVFGDIKNPTGFNLYQRLNNNLEVVGQSTINIPPLATGVDVADIGVLSIDVGAGNVNELATSAAVPTGMSMQVWMTPGLSPGKSFVKSEYRLLQVFAASATSPHDLQAAYNARFGAPPAGQRVFAKIVFINDTTGESSQPQETSTIVLDT